MTDANALPVLQKLRIIRKYVNLATFELSTALLDEIIAGLEQNEIITPLQIADDPVLRIRSMETRLTPTEWFMLVAMNEKYGQCLTHEAITDRTGCNLYSIWVHIRRLRIKLEQLRTPYEIVTIRSRGYSLVDRV